MLFCEKLKGMKGQTGIWIDGKKAIIVHFFNDTKVVDVLESEVEYRRRYPGEGREFSRSGDHIMSKEMTNDERIHHERRMFLQQVAEKLDPDFDIVIFGPAQTKHELLRVLADDHEFETELITLKPADSMTVNQFVDLVQEYFNRVVA